MPRNGNQLRSGINRRLDKHRLYPRMIVEFDDSALIKALEQQCTGIFIPRVAIEAEVEQQYQVTAIGRVDEVIGHTR